MAQEESSIANEEIAVTGDKMTEQSKEQNNSSNHTTSVALISNNEAASILDSSQIPNNSGNHSTSVDLDNVIANTEAASILDSGQIQIPIDLVHGIRNEDENPFVEIQDIVIHTSTLINPFPSESVLVVNKSNNLTSHFSSDDLRSFIPENNDVSCTNCLHNKSNNKSNLPKEVEADNNETFNNISSEQKSLVVTGNNISKDLNDTTKIGKAVKSRLLCQLGPRLQRKCKECGQSNSIFPDPIRYNWISLSLSLSSVNRKS